MIINSVEEQKILLLGLEGLSIKFDIKNAQESVEQQRLLMDLHKKVARAFIISGDDEVSLLAGTEYDHSPEKRRD